MAAASTPTLSLSFRSHPQLRSEDVPKVVETRI